MTESPVVGTPGCLAQSQIYCPSWYEQSRDNLFIFEFFVREDLEYVLRSRQWSFDNRVTVFEVLKPGDQISKLKLDSFEFWVHVLDFCLDGLSMLLVRYSVSH